MSKWIDGELVATPEAIAAVREKVSRLSGHHPDCATISGPHLGFLAVFYTAHLDGVTYTLHGDGHVETISADCLDCGREFSLSGGNYDHEAAVAEADEDDDFFARAERESDQRDYIRLRSVLAARREGATRAGLFRRLRNRRVHPQQRAHCR